MTQVKNDIIPKSCRLCLRNRTLVQSHLISAAMYRSLMRSKASQNPLIVGPGLASTTSKQVRELLLCSDCEERFNVTAEKWLASQIYRDGQFPLANKLTVEMRTPELDDVGIAAFSFAGYPSDVERLAYFALSIIWRAAVRTWRVPFGGQTDSIPLSNSTEEIIRRHLLNEVGFPDCAAVIVSICSDDISQGVICMPVKLAGSQSLSYSFEIPGMTFHVFLEEVPRIVRPYCCVSGATKPILLRDRGDQLFETITNMYSS